MFPVFLYQYFVIMPASNFINGYLNKPFEITLNKFDPPVPMPPSKEVNATPYKYFLELLDENCINFKKMKIVVISWNIFIDEYSQNVSQC